MTDGTRGFPLSAAALAHKAAALPGLLGAVRRRRHRRRARAAAWSLGLVLGLYAALRSVCVGTTPAPTPADAPGWTVVADDAGITTRVAVATVVRPEWFVDDAALQQLLAGAGRAFGLVRAKARTDVTKAAYDPWPGSEPRPSP